MTVPAQLRRQVIQRAQNRCEYCGLAQEGQEAAFHTDHVVPVLAGGETTLSNLALACVSCSRCAKAPEGPRWTRSRTRKLRCSVHVVMCGACTFAGAGCAWSESAPLDASQCWR